MTGSSYAEKSDFFFVAKLIVAKSNFTNAAKPSLKMICSLLVLLFIRTKEEVQAFKFFRGQGVKI